MTALPEIKRTISGKGEIKIPIEYAKAKNIYLYTQVIRRVKTPSLNFTWNPDKGFYAHVSFCIDDYVLQTYDINFVEQVFYIYDGMFAQQLVSLICAVREILNRQPLIDSHEHNIFQPNRIKFECFASSAIELTLKGEKLDLCDEGDSKPNAPPNPPPRLPELPPETAIEVDRPYQDDPNNEGTEPNPGDEFKPDTDFPIGGECESLTVRWVTVDSLGVVNNVDRIVFGPVEGQRIEGGPGNYTIFITCRGDQTTGCVELQEFNFFGYQGESIEFVGRID